MQKLSKTEAEKEIEKFFLDIKNKTPSEIKKIKRLAMRHSVKLGALRKKFCEKCCSPNLKFKSIKNDMKTTECKNCGNILRWKIKN